MSFFRMVGKVIDWLGLRVLLLLAFGIVGYAVLQPLIWSEILGRKLPPTSSNLASLMGIVVTIMSLVLAGFGVVAYQLVEKRSQARLETRARELQDALRMRAAIANAKLFINISVQSFLSYEDLWRKDSYSTASLNSNRELLDFLESAIGNSNSARNELLKLPSALHKRKESAQAMLVCTGNYTYFLATRGYEEDKKLVLELAKTLDRPGLTGIQLETVAWAYLRYSEPGQPLWNTGLSRLAAAVQILEPRDKDTLLSRYKGIFVKDGNLLDGIENALTGQDLPKGAAKPTGSSTHEAD